LTSHALDNIHKFRSGRRKLAFRDQAQFNRGERREIELRTHIAYARWNLMCSPTRNALPKPKRAPDAGKAGRRERQSPRDSFLVQGMERGLPKQTRMIKKDQRNPVWLFARKLLSAEPGHRHRREQGPCLAATALRECQRHVEPT